MTGLTGAYVLVTGGSGYLGAHVLRRLEQLGVRAVDLSRTTATGFCGDVRSYEDVLSATRGVDAVIHLAVSPGFRAAADPRTDADVNVIGTLNVLRAMSASGGATFVHASTSYVYGPSASPVAEDSALRPTTVYGASKLAAEHYVRVFASTIGFRAPILRFPTLYGPSAGRPVPNNVVARFTADARANRAIVLHQHPDHPLDLLNVTDAAEALLIALAAEHATDTYNVGSGEPIALGQVADLVLRAAGSRSEIKVDLRDDPPPPALDIRKAARELGFRPMIGPREGIEAFVRGAVHA